MWATGSADDAAKRTFTIGRVITADGASGTGTSIPIKGGGDGGDYGRVAANCTLLHTTPCVVPTLREINFNEQTLLKFVNLKLIIASIKN